MKTSRLIALTVAMAATATAGGPVAASQAACPSGVTDPAYCSPSAPAVVTQAATAITSAGATLTGRVVPNGLATQYGFQYGPTTSYGKTTPLMSLPADYATHPVSAVITGLLPGTTYNARLVATNSSGTTAGANITFKTAGAAPGPGTGGKKVPGLTLKAKPKRDRNRPFRYKASGALKLPAGVTRPAGCQGTVVLTLKRGSTTVGRVTTRLNAKCRYSKTIAVTSMAKLSKKRPNRLRMGARFTGNTLLKAKSSARITVRYG